MPANDNVAISSIDTLDPQLFIAIKRDVNVWPTLTGVQDRLDNSNTYGGVVQEGGGTT